jgi:hypothetical protein
MSYELTARLAESELTPKQEALLGDVSSDGCFIQGQDNMSRNVEEVLLPSW